jgi:transposase
MPKRNGSVHVATTKRTYNGKVYVSHLLRRSYREGGKVKHQTLGNLSHLPPDLIDTIRHRLAGGLPEAASGRWEIVRSLPHGHVVAVLGSLRRIGLESLLASRRSAERDLAVALIIMRLIAPQSKLATCRGLLETTATSSLPLELQLADDVTERDLYRAMDWLLERQPDIEQKLAEKHLKDGTLVLYDVTSSYYTGRRSDLVKFGHDRDGKKGFPQIVYGLLCSPDGCPLAIEVFEGNTADPNTLNAQIQKLRKRFNVQRVVLVGDRGMITTRRINESFRDAEGLEWITALRADSIKKLVSAGTIQLSLFDERDLAEVESADFPGERLIVCKNPLLADERARKRNELLVATEKKLEPIVAATQRKKNRLHGKDKIGIRIGRVINHYKVAKHFELTITDDGFGYKRREDQIAAEAALDGLYVIRTSVSDEMLNSENTVRAYKDLSKVERAFRCMKTVDLHVRPIYHWLNDRIKAHVFLCMLAYYVEWHMRRDLAPILFDDHDRESAQAERKSIVTPSPRSAAARSKDHTKETEDGFSVHSFRTLLADLGTLCKNRIRVNDDSTSEFYMVTKPTDEQRRILALLSVNLSL